MEASEAFTIVLDRLIESERDRSKTGAERGMFESQLRMAERENNELRNRVPPPFDVESHLRLLREIFTALQTAESAPLMALNRRLIHAIHEIDPTPF